MDCMISFQKLIQYLLNYLPANPVSMLNIAGRPGKNLFRPAPLTTTLLASPVKTGTCATVPLLVLAKASI